MGAERQENELTDVVLCYQSMGISLDASPAAIEQIFKNLSEEYKKKLSSPDPAVREDARVSLETMSETYEKIRGSITYQAMEKDYQRKTAQTSPAATEKAHRPVHQAVVEKSLMMNCPRCNGSVVKGSRVCPICKSRIYTTSEQILRAIFTPKKIAIYCILLALAVFALVRLNAPASAPADKGAAAKEESAPVPAQGQEGQNQAPAAPGQDAQPGQAPAAPGQDAQGQAPAPQGQAPAAPAPESKPAGQ